MAKNIKVNWDDRGLHPTGNLRLLECKLDQSEIFLRVKAVAEDEIGAHWDVSHSNLLSELRCVKYPDILRASYHAQRGTFYRTYIVQASSFKEARDLLKKEFPFIQSPEFLVHRPDDKAPKIQEK